MKKLWVKATRISDGFKIEGAFERVSVEKATNEHQFWISVKNHLYFCDTVEIFPSKPRKKKVDKQ
jgi:hypothetical protein